MVSAQQLRESDRAARSASADSTSSTDSAQSTVYGMTAVRGARYLLRNGLDYLNYQQYERALKFLRDAEARQKELNDAEKRALKRGIESAQRGLREAADAESPYALSERSRRRNGFTAAKPEVNVATNTGDRPSTRSVQSTDAGKLGTEPEDRGEPIRLTSTDDASKSSAAQDRTKKGGTGNQLANTSRRQSVASPSQLPEIPKLPDFVSVPDVSVSGGIRAPRDAAGTENAAATAATEAPTIAAAPRQSDRTPQVQDQAVYRDEPGSASPAQEQQQQEVRTASALAEPERPAAATAAAEPSPTPTVIELETTPSTVQANQTAKADEAGTRAHVETETPSPPPISAAGSEVRSVSEKAANSQPPGAEPANALPPLPAEAAETGAKNSAVAAGSSAVPTQVPSSPSPTGADDLPPLPAGRGQTEDTDSAPSASPPPVAVPTAGPAAPTGEANLPLLPDAAPASVAPPMSPPQPSPDAREAAADRTGEDRLPDHPQVRPAPSATGEPGTAGGNSSTALQLSTELKESGNAATASALPSSDTTSVSLPPLPEEAAAAVPPDRHEPTVGQVPMDREPPTSPAAGVSAAAEGDSSHPDERAHASGESRIDSFIPRQPHYSPPTLRPELQREVDRIARLQEEELRRGAISPPQPAQPPDSTTSALRMQTQQDISRAPSPAEARPIKAIPVPEDWVPLPPRDWTPQRKYWAAAATCHLPLYFQDPVLERYGHSVEQFVGPFGRYLTYPVDDPTQSTQRNQILQPFASAGLFGLQIIAWPYNLIMDPPWEAQYDLGYYRPGDQIPTDTYWLPLHGYGPPLRGNKY